MNTVSKSARSPKESSNHRPRASDVMPAKPVRVAKTSKTAKRESVARKVNSAKSTSAPVRLILRARAVMADRGFRSISALQRSLAAIGVVISLPQLIRVVDGEAKHINKDVIEGMLTLFQCGVAELLVMA
jgi:Cro/C1-type HTH DNA-binding domain